ncbi:hypothetical protein HY212_04280 [Candidatus Pacearchaeota archaeon]|nr:hypothetical protein [Candidatus Pacearchaeota archaeon]
MAETYFGSLYREESEQNSKTKYHFRVNQVVSGADQEKWSWSFVQRYNDLTAQQVNDITREVFKHRGVQKTLLDKIDSIVLPIK